MTAAVCASQCRATVDVEDRSVEVLLWNTAGQERFVLLFRCMRSVRMHELSWAQTSIRNRVIAFLCRAIQRRLPPLISPMNSSEDCVELMVDMQSFHDSMIQLQSWTAWEERVFP
jgi:hypothetical protein